MGPLEVGAALIIETPSNVGLSIRQRVEIMDISSERRLVPVPNDLHMRAAMRSQLHVARDHRSSAMPDKQDAKTAPTSAQIEDLRAYLRGLSNQELRAFGTAARRKCEQTEPGSPVAVAFAIDLEAALAEFRRRRAKKPQPRATRQKIVRAGLKQMRAEIFADTKEDRPDGSSTAGGIS